MACLVVSQTHYFRTSSRYYCLNYHFLQAGSRTHERALRIAYNDFSSNFEQLLLKDNTVTTHTRNLKQLATEIYKTIHHENPSFMEEIFIINESPYNLRGVAFTRNKPNTVA